MGRVDQEVGQTGQADQVVNEVKKGKWVIGQVGRALQVGRVHHVGQLDPVSC